MQQQELRWKPNPPQRAPRIQPEDWERHRKELTRMYQYLTLNEIIIRMQVLYHFKPSRRQYVSQFDKWGLSKYNKRVEAVTSSTYSGSETATPDTVQYSPSVAISTPNTEITEVQNVDSGGVGRPHRRTNSPPTLVVEKPHSPPANTLSDTRAQQPTRKRSLKSLSNKTTRLQISPPVALISSTNAMASWPSTTVTSSTSESIPANNESDVSPMTSFSALPKIDLQPIPESPGGRESEVGEPSQAVHIYKESSSGERTEATQTDSTETESLGKAGPHIVKPQILSKGRDQELGAVDTNSLKLAADLLSAVNCHDLSFKLHDLVLKRLAGFESYRAVAISCACSAMTKAQANHARPAVESLVEEDLTKVYKAKHFLYYKLLECLCWMQDEDHAASLFRNQARAWTQEEWFQVPSQQKSALNIRTLWYLLNHDSGWAGSQFSRMLDDNDRIFILLGGGKARSSIRSCLAWCELQLKQSSLDLEDSSTWASSLALWSWPKFSFGSLARHCDALNLFFDLWKSWRRQCGSTSCSPVEGRLLFWAEGTSDEISPSEILATASLMILDACQVHVVDLFDDEQSVLQRALRGAGVLSQESDFDVARAFIKSYCDRRMSWPDFHTLDQGIAASIHSAAIACVQDGIGLDLASLGLNELDMKDRTSRAVPTSEDSPRVSSVSSAMASSLCSSDLSSMRSVQMRLRQKATNDGKLGPPGRPSSVMSDVSTSSWSLRHLLGVSWSSRGTLMTMSEQNEDMMEE